jgi:pimeloyl-ACP methyl ester carboxylesterase
VPTFRSGDFTIHYLDAGRGVPVVLVHSGGLSSRQWTRWTPRLEGTHRVVAPDLLGSGASDPVPPEAPFHFSQDVAALDAVLDALATPFHLVGHSYGGLVALTSARQRPARVLSLSLFEPVAFGVLYSAGDAAGIHSLESYDHDGTFLDDAAGGSEPWLERFIDWWQGAGAWQALPAPSRAAFLKVGRKVFQEVRSLTADRTPHEAYAGLTPPALVMTAKRSPLAAQRVCAILARALPRAELVTFDDAGHMAPLTHAHVISERVAAHVRAHDPAPTA